ncbi:fimbrial protein [Salmonella enterica]|nr:fimbrial protein [Salmonella enterica]EJA5086780.1 fimbrial protein [Salmonella enterica]
MTLVSKLKKVLKKKEVAALVTSVCLMAYSSGATAFTCQDSTGRATKNPNNAVIDIYANLNPFLEPGQVLVVDFSSSISCKSDMPGLRNNYVSLNTGSTFSGVLDNFTGSLDYYGTSYPLPLQSQTKSNNFMNGYYIPLRSRLLLKPVSEASGILITAGEKIATLKMIQVGSDIGTGANQNQHNYTWNIHAANSVFLPTGGCDVSLRNVTVTLPDYPGTAAVPLSVHCGQNQQLAYYLTGTTVDTASTIFTNTSSFSPATGVGVQLSNRNGIVATNKNVSLGSVGISPVSLDLTASYARTTGQVVAGNVQSVIGVTFVYE